MIDSSRSAPSRGAGKVQALRGKLAVGIGEPVE